MIRWIGVLCGVVALLGMLAACGGTPPTAPGAAPAHQPAAAAGVPAADEPTDVVQQALDRLAQNDQPGLTALFDPVMSDILRSGAAMEAWNRWDTLQSPYATNGIGGRGPIQTLAMQPPEPRSTDTLVLVQITYEDALVRWDFALRETTHGWRMTDITRTTLEEQ